MGKLRVLNTWLLSAAVLCFALSGLAKTLEFGGDDVAGELAIPEGCDNPLVEARPFFIFFEAAIVSAAIERGADAAGVAELFAVSELASDLLQLTPNLAEESPIDRMVRGQICHFQVAYDKKRDPGVKKKLGPTSGDTELHNHLVKIAPQLFRDALKVVESVMVNQAKADQKRERMESRMAQVRKARSLGRARVDQSL